ncbi:hypothetical protein GCM10010206_54280 [Streptomyces cinerochromogenes]|nr:hypothetical protein GCM10010206_54280 [Streptomyces cinerochromogenes]
MGDPDQDAQALALDLAHRLAVHDDARAVHPLHHRTHADHHARYPAPARTGPNMDLLARI